MEIPSTLLSDLSIGNRDGGIDLRMSLPSAREMLVRRDNTVLWYKGDTISRKLTYETRVVNAFFTRFMSDEVDEKTLVVVLSDSAYFYYSDGRNYVSSFPFQIENALPYENGVILERSQSQNSPFLTITEPMNELGSVVSSSTSSISSDERLLHFPKSHECSITVTFDTGDNSINLYHTRFLNRANTYMQNSGNKRKPSQSMRKTSLVPGHANKDQETGDDEIRIEKKRSTSHSHILSIDRMASYDFNANSKSSDTKTSSASESQTLRKDAILSKIENIKLKLKSDPKSFKVASISCNGREAIIVQNAKTKVLQTLIFETSGSLVSIPKFLKYLNLSDEYVDYATTSLEGFLVLLNKKNELILFNPFLQISTVLFKPSIRIKEIYETFDTQVVTRDVNGNIQSLELILGPRKEIIEKLLGSFKYLVNAYTYNYIRVIYINALSAVTKEWDAFILTILTLILPFAVHSSDLDDSNEVSQSLSKVGILQMKALSDQFSICEMAPNITLALHLVYEELKTNVLHTESIHDLGLLLSQLTYWMSWGETWYGYYGIPTQKLSKSIKFPQLQILDQPPNLLRSLASLFEGDIVPYCTFSRLAQESEQIDELVTPRTFYILRLFEAIVSADFTPNDIVNMMTEFNITTQILETYPTGVILPLKEAISFCQEHLTSMNGTLQNFELLERKDLEVLNAGVNEVLKDKSSHKVQHQAKDIHQIISSIQDPSEPLAPIEHDRFNITKLIFSEDRSFYEISKILQTFQVQTIMADDISSLLEQQRLMRQQELAGLVALRTLTIPIGRSMLFFSSKIPLVTERFPLPKINFTALIQPENVTVSLERSNISDTALQWGYFHNGAATGLTISKDTTGISGSWIVFNKPDNLSAQHGGFLLGLGLNGHLKSLEEWNIYNYLGPKHVFTSVGLLLGMSASLRGSMDMKLTRVLSVHVVALLPRGASDLIISVPVQTAGLIGIGLLYLETQHRRMSEILLSQINSNVIAEEKQLADESYRLAAGIGLGYVNLGKGDDLQGLNDTHVVDKLFEIANCMKDVQSEDGYDKSMPGAVIALAFIYLKTNNEAIAKKLQIPETEQLLDYIRPDILILRALARNLILWDKIGQGKNWVESQIPSILLSKSQYTGELNHNLSYYYIVSGLCLVIGIRFASTADKIAKNTLMSYYDQVTQLLMRIGTPENFTQRQIRQTLIHAQMIMAISLSLVMAATGDLDVFRRLRILHGRFNNSASSETFGKLMATNMALGFLFLGGGQYAFNTESNFGIAALVTSIYPLFPNSENSDPDVHLQALRHFWSLAVESRCLIVRDIETNKPFKTEVDVEFMNGQTETVISPCLLPPLSTIKKLTTRAHDYYKLIIDDIEKFKNDTTIYIFKKKKVDVLKHSVKIILKELNEKFKETSLSEDKLVNLKIFDHFKKSDVSFLLDEIPAKGFSPNIVDRQVELTELAKKPQSANDLWNLKLIFAFYDRILSEEDVHYMTFEFVDMLQDIVWSLSRNF